MTAQPFTRDGAGGEHLGASRTLRSGWNRIEFTVPSQPTPLGALGLQLNNDPGWQGALHLDAVSWP